ncbi:hypothetical protein [Mycolicibacterium sp.]|uniref:hypothetical protein n=1 Tax=Mycolicibacterium sp. TaxID=2320850 RepID=UPI001A18C1AA|nr:hypothetical protein [Mycolicibacterium sp.]MBJ7338008.1 hypothetical protein [Mycolicibacterium sp.]
MRRLSTRAARFRGVLVGATSGAVAVAAHGVGGGMHSGTPAIVVLVLCSAAVGALASGDEQRGLSSVASFLAAGQFFGHHLLVFVSGHSHGQQWSVSMVSAHAAAAIVAAALICTAERLFAAVGGTAWQLVLVLLALRDTRPAQRPRSLWWTTGLAARILAIPGRVTRGPPSFAAA